MQPYLRIQRRAIAVPHDPSLGELIVVAAPDQSFDPLLSQLLIVGGVSPDGKSS